VNIYIYIYATYTEGAHRGAAADRPIYMCTYTYMYLYRRTYINMYVYIYIYTYTPHILKVHTVELQRFPMDL